MRKFASVLRVLQLSDCHVSAGADADYRGQSADRNLASLLPEIRRWQPDFILLTGDVSEDGSAAAYGRVFAKLNSTGAPVLALPGNHDEPAVMRRYFPQGPWDAPLVRDAKGWKLVLLNSAAENAKEVADRLRDEGRRVGVVSLNVLRPFPADELRDVLRGVRAIVVGDRGDSYGAQGGNLSLEVRAALQQDPDNRTLVLSRVYGLGGKDFYETDAEQFFDEARDAADEGRVQVPFAYHGAFAGDPDKGAPPGLPPLTSEEVSRGMATVTPNPETGPLEVELKPLREMTTIPSRIAARSTTAGTPVKSCISTRAGR